MRRPSRPACQNENLASRSMIAYVFFRILTKKFIIFILFLIYFSTNWLSKNLSILLGFYCTVPVSAVHRVLHIRKSVEQVTDYEV